MALPAILLPSTLLAFSPLLVSGLARDVVPPALTLVDVTLQDASAAGAFDLALGHDVDLIVTGEPGAAVLLAASFTPPPDPPPWIGGAPLGVDPAGLFLLVNGLADPSAVVGPDGVFTRGTVVPDALDPGAPLYLQALTVSAAPEIALTPGVAATVVDALVFDFDGTDDGFVSDLSDYHAYMLPGIAPEAAVVPLPAPLDPADQAMRVFFKNESDDVFFFLKRRIDGLTPLAPRALRIDVRFASNAPEDSVGAGGSPGLDVTMKAGGATIEPMPIPSTVNPEFVTFNLDKGDQVQGGDDLPRIGDVAIAAGVTDWTIKDNRMKDPLVVTADAAGSLWVAVGTDSGFEGHNELYYDRIVVKLLE